MNKHVKKIIIAVSIMLAALVLAMVGYVIYVAASYSRIEDNLRLAAKNNSELSLAADKEFQILTYNISFGAYSPEFDFFMDKGEMTDGKKVKGSHGKGISKDDVRRNMAGIAGIIGNLEYDFVFAQEVDEDGDRSYHIDQREWLQGVLPGYGSVYAKNFHSAYLFYPFGDPHGKNDSGLLTLSRYKIKSAERKSLPVATDLSKFFDLDRCFSVTRIAVGERDLVLINIHLSAYDEGGKIRKQQLEAVSEFLASEREKDNYVVAGGDFNHDICGSAGTFDSMQIKPDWVASLMGDELPSGYSFAEADNKAQVPTCRSADMPYQKGVNYTVIVDGFIVSDNIEIISVENQNTEFAFSDHNPVYMRFKLKE